MDHLQPKNKRLNGESELEFSSPIKRFEIQRFQLMSKKVKTSKEKSQKEIMCQRDILWKTLMISHNMKTLLL